MKKTTLIIYGLFLLSLGLISSSVIDNGGCLPVPLKSMGGPPYNTNAPGEKTCSGTEGTSTCHSGCIPDNSGSGTPSIISSGGTLYVPGQTYTITPTITHATRMRFGFQLVALRTSNNANAGTIILTDTAKTDARFPTYGNYQTRYYIMHKKAGTYFSTTTGQWPFLWKAPATNVGTITMYACFNAANDDGFSTGDECYFTTLTLIPSLSGINEQDEISLLNVYPNPGNGEFYVKMNGVEETVFTVYNVQGNKVQQFTSPAETVKLDIRNNTKGIYFLVVSNEQSTSVHKLIVE